MKVFFLRFGKERELGCEKDKQDNEKLQEFVLIFSLQIFLLTKKN